MKKISTQFLLWPMLGFILAVFLTGAALIPYFLSAAASGPLAGYAWSDTIGWVSLSCTTGGPTGNNICGTSNYGLTVAGNGTVSGYAWSDNIGWISANNADASHPAPALVGGSFTGWLKALSGGGAGSGGWDGWISLNCSNTGTCATSNYGVTETNGAISGYAWGSDIVGWLSFSNVSPFPPMCALVANPSTIVRGASSNLQWTSSSATAGAIAPGAINATPVASGAVGVAPNTTTTYTGTFTGSGGSVQCSAQLTVTCAALYSCSGQTIQYTDASCNTSNVTTCAAPNYCTPGQSTCSVPPIGFSPSPNATGHLEAKPVLVREGGTTRLFWDVTNASSCTVSGNGNSWTMLSSGSSGVQSNPINSSVTYTLNCTALPGGTPLTAIETVTIVPAPKFEER